MKVALTGQPNCGKSTVFNAVAGYRSLTSNFAGTTVEYTRGQAHLDDEVIEMIDLPGLYSLIPTSAVEEVSRDYLRSREWDVIVNVLDTSQLARSLELTLELLDLEAPMVVCLNMMDEAARKGMTVDTHGLEAALGVPVVQAIGSRGRGILETFRAAKRVAAEGHRARPFVYAPHLEGILNQLAENLPAGTGRLAHHKRPHTVLPVLPTSPVPACGGGLCHSSCCARALPSGWTGQELADRWEPSLSTSTAVAESACQAASDPLEPQSESLPGFTVDQPSTIAVFPPLRFQALQSLQSKPSQLESEVRSPESGISLVDSARAEVIARTGMPADAAVSAARHAACLSLFERVTKVSRPRPDWRERVDQVALHSFWGYVLLAAVFLGFFRLIFNVGALGESRILTVFDAIVTVLTHHMNPQGALFAAAKGAVLGTAGAGAIVLPYLLPFLLGLAILEDLGYLSRVGYLMDAGMHRLGLHGTATLPILVGYGCSVPAVMATRILSTRRDRFIAAFLAVLVPCSARMTVIFALTGFYLGPNYALGIYALNIIVVALSGHALAQLWPEVSPGMLMEVPAYRVPGIKVVAFKTWWRLREFVLVAFPLLVVGSVVLSLVDFYGWQHAINAALAPFTALLGLPRSVGLTLIFGVLRKELSLLMLMQALGTTHVLGAMTAAQILIFTLFVTFYLPCMATLASMLRELGWRLMLAASTALLALAIIVSLTARGVWLLL